MKSFFPFVFRESPQEVEPLGGGLSPEELERFRTRLAQVSVIILLLFGIIFLRLWLLQLVEGEQLRQRSESNRIRTYELPPWRGMILDRQGEILVDNRPSFDLLVLMEDVPDPVLLARRLTSLLHLDNKALVTQLETAREAKLHTARLKTNLTWEEMALVETYKAELPGVFIQIAPKREYRHKGLAPHVLGYLGEISEAQLKSGRFPNYKVGDYLGRAGIEAAWEDYLRGERGFRRLEVDAYGRELGQLELKLPTSGANLHLTLDLSLQREAEACLEGKMGAIVALETQTGKILALASSPAYSPEAFERGLTTQEWQALVNRKDHPLENRALRGQYPPGSTFKIVMAVAALEEKIITPRTAFVCTGALEVGDHVFHCWKSSGHGSVNLRQAMAASCDVYFYQLGRRLGIERIAKWSRQFGLGEPTGLKLDREMPGLVASAAWKLARFRSPWREGDTCSVAIGQGYNLVTPLQMAQVVAAVANGGIIYEPQLVEKVASPTGEVLHQFRPVIKRRLGAHPSTLATIREALEAVVSQGTGRRAALPHLQVAGKTGTAQVTAIDREKTGKKKARLDHHAWFVAYAPAEEPQVAVSVLVEHGGQGGEVAAPLARRILAAYLHKGRMAKER